MTNQLVALGFVLIAVAALAIYSLRFRGKLPTVPPFPVFPSLSDEVGRVAEEGDSVHIALGKGGLVSNDAMTSVAALQGLGALIDLSAGYDTPPVITTGDPTLYVLVGDWMRRAYARLGNAALYRPAFVQFVAPSPTTYAAMAATYLFDGGIGSNIVLGAFDQEAIFLTDAAERRGIHSMGGAVSATGLGALYPALGQEHLVMGEEMFAGGAVVTQRPTYWASMWAEDALRWLVVVGIIGAAIASLMGLGG